MDMRLGAVESRFADIVWANAPMSTKTLIELCEKELNWKRTTTYTVLKKFCNRGILHMEKRQVTVLIPRDEFYALQSAEYVDVSFKGSLPAFVAAFTSRKKLSETEFDQIMDMINKAKEDTK